MAVQIVLIKTAATRTVQCLVTVAIQTIKAAHNIIIMAVQTVVQSVAIKAVQII